MVKRYDCVCESYSLRTEKESDTGRMVLFSDYEALQRQLEEAHAHMRLMRDWMREEWHHYGDDWDTFVNDYHQEAATWDFGEGGK